MKETCGIMYVAFGIDYLHQCHCSIRLARKVLPDIPILIVTNMENDGSKDTALGRVTVHRVQAWADDNRAYRTSAIAYSPFDLTVCMDTDTAILSSEFMTIFDKLKTHDIALVENAVVNKAWVRDKSNDLRKLYRICERRWGFRYPLTLYSGGVVGFTRSELAFRFFNTWHVCWKEYGGGRDMPPLAVAAQKTGAKIASLPGEWNGLGKNLIVDHLRKGHKGIPGLPKVKKRKPKILSCHGIEAKIKWVQT